MPTSLPSLKMSLHGNERPDDFILDFSFLFNNIKIENVEIILLDEKNDTVSYNGKYSFLADTISSKINYDLFNQIPSQYRVSKDRLNYISFFLFTDIEPSEFKFLIIKSTIKDSTGVNTDFENKYKFESREGCDFHFFLH